MATCTQLTPPIEPINYFNYFVNSDRRSSYDHLQNGQKYISVIAVQVQLDTLSSMLGTVWLHGKHTYLNLLNINLNSIYISFIMYLNNIYMLLLLTKHICL
jgi:hypothetical protein